MRDDDFAASYKYLNDKLKAIVADDSCFSGACREKFYERKRLCMQLEKDVKLNSELLEDNFIKLEKARSTNLLL